MPCKNEAAKAEVAQENYGAAQSATREGLAALAATLVAADFFCIAAVAGGGLNLAADAGCLAALAASYALQAALTNRMQAEGAAIQKWQDALGDLTGCIDQCPPWAKPSAA